MQVRELMTKMPACCLPDTPLQEVAEAMVQHNCGALPVVESRQTMRLAGVITDRDILCRTIAKGKNPMSMTVKECMSAPAITLMADMSLEDCCKTMEENQVRRVPVVDDRGVCFGIVTQAHIARHAPESLVAHVLHRISRPNRDPSNVATTQTLGQTG